MRGQWRQEIQCHFCARLMGVVVLAWEGAPVPREWCALRCCWCGGQATRGECEYKVPVDHSVKWEKIRRGRKTNAERALALLEAVA